MKITRRQLRRIIKEEKARLISERSTDNPALRSEELALRKTVVNFADAYMLTMGMNPGDPSDAKRTRSMINDIINGAMGVFLK